MKVNMLLYITHSNQQRQQLESEVVDLIEYEELMMETMTQDCEVIIYKHLLL